MLGSPPPTCSNEARRYGVIMMDTLNYDKSIPLVVLLRCGSLNIHQLAKMSSPFFFLPHRQQTRLYFSAITHFSAAHYRLHNLAFSPSCCEKKVFPPISIVPLDYDSICFNLFVIFFTLFAIGGTR